MSERPDEGNVFFGDSGNEPYHDPSWAANRIAELEAELVEAKAETKKFKVISGVVGNEISRKLDQIKHWLEEVDKLEEQRP